jgi:hypothetical protein
VFLHVYFLLSFYQEWLFVKIRLGHFTEEYCPATAIGRVPHVHADIGTFEEFFAAGFGVLQEAGHDTDIARLVPYFQQLYFLQQNFICFSIDRTGSCGFSVKDGRKIRIGDGFQFLVVLCDLYFELISIIKQRIPGGDIIGTEMTLPDACNVLRVDKAKRK